MYADGDMLSEVLDSAIDIANLNLLPLHSIEANYPMMIYSSPLSRCAMDYWRVDELLL